MMLCFTPPTGTYLGLESGLDEELVPISERPDDIDVVSDWIKPGGPAAREKCIELLLQYGASATIVDSYDYTYLHYAAMWGWADAAFHLLEAKIDVNAVNAAGKTPLHMAIEYHHPGFIEKLLDNAALMVEAADSEGNTALLMAIEQGEEGYECASILLKGGADPNAYNHR